MRVVVSHERHRSPGEAKVHVQGSFFSKGWPREDIAVVRSDGTTVSRLNYKNYFEALCLKEYILRPSSI